MTWAEPWSHVSSLWDCKENTFSASHILSFTELKCSIYAGLAKIVNGELAKMVQRLTHSIILLDIALVLSFLTAPPTQWHLFPRSLFPVLLTSLLLFLSYEREKLFSHLAVDGLHFSCRLLQHEPSLVLFAQACCSCLGAGAFLPFLYLHITYQEFSFITPAICRVSVFPIPRLQFFFF